MINIGKATGYKHARRMQRMTQDTSIRNTNKSEVVLGASALIGLLLPFILVAFLFGLG